MAATSSEMTLDAEQILNIFSHQGLNQGFIKQSQGEERNEAAQIVYSEKYNSVIVHFNTIIVAVVHCVSGIYDACLVRCGRVGWHLWTLSSIGTIACTFLPSLGGGTKEKCGSSAIHNDSNLEDQLQEAAQIQTTVQDCDTQHNSQHARRIMIMNGYLVIVILQDGLCVIELFQILKNDCPEKTRISNMLISYQLPNANVDGNKHDGDVICFCVRAPVTDGDDTMNNLPSQCAISTKYLYNQIFDMEDNLMEVPMLLVGLPSGRIYSVPIRFPYVKPQPKLLCDLQQPVLGIHGLSKQSLKHSKIYDSSDSLLFVSSLGKMVLLQASEADEEPDYPVKYDTKYFFIKGPVLCTLVMSGYLIHSTGQALCITSLLQLFEREQYFDLESEIHNVGRVIAMSSINTTKEQKENLIEWISLNKRGWLYRYRLALSDGGLLGKVQSINSGSQNLKDLLNGMAQTTEQLNKIKEKVTVIDSILGQLSLAGYIAATASTDNTDSSSVPLLLETEISQQSLGAFFKVTLRVRLKNQSPIKLSKDWSLILTLSKWTGFEKPNPSWSGDMSRGVSLCELGPTEFQEMHMDLTTESLIDMPLRIQASLCYDFKSSLPELLLTGKEHMLIIALPDHSIDVLNTLQSRMNKTHGLSHKGGKGKNPVNDIAERRPCAALHVLQSRESSRPLTTESLVITISEKEIRKETMEFQGGKFASALLCYILQGSGIPVPSGDVSVRAQTLIHSTPVTLTIREPQKGKLEIVLESCDLQSLVHLRMAVSNRLQKLRRQQTIVGDSLSMRIYKDIENEASLLRDEMCEKGKVSSDFIQRVINMYMSLRSLYRQSDIQCSK